MRPVRGLHMVMICLAALLGAASAVAAPYQLNYAGRLTDNSGKPIAGPVDLDVKFYRLPAAGAPIAVTVPAFDAVPLASGGFAIDLSLSETDYDVLFDGAQDVWIEIKDLTNNRTYPRQRFGAVPYALKVPVDGKTLSYDADGKLTVGPSGTPGANEFLTKDGSGNLIYAPATSNPGTVTQIVAGSGLTGGTITGSGTIALADPLPAISGANLTGVNAVSLQGSSVAVTVPTVIGQVLKWNGANWAPGTDATLGSGAITDGQNLGASGAGYADIFESAVAPDLRFRRLKAGTGMSVVQNADDVTINSTITQYNDAAASAAAVQAGVITDAVTKAPTHDAVFDALATKAATSHTHAATDVGGGTIDNTEFGYLNNVSSNIQTQLNGKAASAHLHAATDIGNGDVSNFELSTLDGVTSGVQAQLDGKQAAVTAGARLGADLVGDGSVSNVEYGYINSLTSNAQTQIDAKHPLINAGARLNADLVGDGSVSTTELSYINSLTSNAQTQINAKQATLTTGSALDVASVTTNVQGGVTLKPFGVAAGETGEARFNDLAAGGSFYAAIKSPDTLAANYTLTLPANDGNNLEVLQTNGSGALSWAAIPSAPVSSVNGNTGAVVLDAASIAPTATRLWLSNTDKASYDTAYTDRNKWDGGATGLTAATGRTSLGLVIGTDVQAYDAGLQSIAAKVTAADQMLYTTASDTYAVTGLTSFGRALIDDASVAAQQATLSLVPGTNVQAYDAGLQSIAGLTTAADQMVYTTAADTYATTGLTSFGRALLDDASVAAQRTTLGLGTMATQAASAVAITGGTIAGTTISGFTSTGIDDNADAVAMTINSSENVGIGTTNPQAKLEVVGAIKVPGGTQTLMFNDTNETGTPAFDGFRIRNDADFFSVGGEALVIEKTDGNNPDPDGGIAFVNTGNDGVITPSMVIKGTGNIGIGTTSPVNKLEIRGPALSQYGISTSTDSVGRGVEIVSQDYAVGSAGSAMSLNLGAGSGSTYSSISAATAGKTVPGVLSLNPTGGNVGIGIAAPLTTLHVAKTDAAATMNIDAMMGAGNSQINFRRAYGTTASPTIVASGSSMGGITGQAYDGASFIEASRILFGVDGTPGTNDMPSRISFQTTPDGSATPAEVMRVTNSGAVGIGTISPDAKLHVAGDIKIGNSSATCNATTEGSQRYNSTSKVMEFCNGTAWTSPASTVDYILYTEDVAAGGVSTILSGAWRTRTLATEKADTGNHATRSGAQITLQPGKYRCILQGGGYQSEHVQVRLANITDGTFEYGTPGHSNDQEYTSATSVLHAYLNLATAKVFEYQLRVNVSGGNGSPAWAMSPHSIMDCLRFQN